MAIKIEKEVVIRKKNYQRGDGAVGIVIRHLQSRFWRNTGSKSVVVVGHHGGITDRSGNTRAGKVENVGKETLVLETMVGGLYNFFYDVLGEEGKQYIP